MRRFLIATSIAGALLAFAAGVAAQVGAEVALRAAIEKETVKGDLKGAIDQYKKLAQGKDRTVAAKALVHMGQCYEKLGDAEARNAYERVVKEFGDQKEAVAEARKFLAARDSQAEKGVVERQVWTSGKSLQINRNPVYGFTVDRRYGQAVSRDGKLAAFTHGSTVWIHDLVTGDERRLVGERGSPLETLHNAIVSPDGKLVAYARTPSAAAQSTELYVVGSDSSAPHRLAGNYKRVVASSWSPDGKQILANIWGSDDAQPKTAFVSVADGSVKLIGGLLASPRLSPDGRYITFLKHSSGAGNQADIYVHLVDGGGEYPLVENFGPVTTVLWAADGKRVLFVSSRNGGNGLWSIPVADGKPMGIPELAREKIGSLLDVTRDGDYYYQEGTLTRDLYQAAIDPQTGKLTARPTRATSQDTNAGAVWSPDGELLAYYRFKSGGGNTALMIRSTKTGEEHEVAPKSPFRLASWRPQWFPDSRSLLVHSWDGLLRRLDVRTGEFTPLLDSVALPAYRDAGRLSLYQAFVILAPDGHTVYYLTRDVEAQQTRIFRKSLDAGSEVELCRLNADAVGDLSISPDVPDSRHCLAGSVVAD
jgi:dipeptidyl aminopeptidase/acylaminoacyl peptidase/Skp family chaperone for outer membrane proteins